MNILGYTAVFLGILAISEQALDLDQIDLVDIALSLFSVAVQFVLIKRQLKVPPSQDGGKGISIPSPQRGSRYL